MQNKNDQFNTEIYQNLYKAFLKLRTEEEIMFFLQDILSAKELSNMASKLKAAHMLNQSKSYLEIVRETGLSSATVAKVSSSLQYGTQGYKIVLDRLKL